MDLAPNGSPELIYDLLQNLMGGPYHKVLVTWLLEYKHLFGPVSKWLSARGLDFNNYAAHLKDGGLCDGLEIWLISLILQCPINVVQESMVHCSQEWTFNAILWP